jgi:hypothetical protein
VFIVSLLARGLIQIPAKNNMSIQIVRHTSGRSIGKATAITKSAMLLAVLMAATPA